MLKTIKFGISLLLLINITACHHDDDETEDKKPKIYVDKPRITSASKVIAYQGETVVMVVTASDLNKDDLNYYLKGNDSQYFRINNKTGEVFFVKTPNYEEGTVYDIIVGAEDFSRNRGEMHVRITLSTDTKPPEEPTTTSGFDYTLSVTVDSTKSNGTSWDILGGAPDIRVILDDIVHEGKCQDSFKCDFGFSSNQTTWKIQVVDQDISEHDSIGVGTCNIGVNVIGESIIDIVQNN